MLRKQVQNEMYTVVVFLKSRSRCITGIQPRRVFLFGLKVKIAFNIILKTRLFILFGGSSKVTDQTVKLKLLSKALYKFFLISRALPKMLRKRQS